MHKNLYYKLMDRSVKKKSLLQWYGLILFQKLKAEVIVWKFTAEVIVWKLTAEVIVLKLQLK